MAHFAHGVLGHIEALSAGKPKKRDVVVVTVVRVALRSKRPAREEEVDC